MLTIPGWLQCSVVTGLFVVISWAAYATNQLIYQQEEFNRRHESLYSELTLLRNETIRQGEDWQKKYDTTTALLTAQNDSERLQWQKKYESGTQALKDKLAAEREQWQQQIDAKTRELHTRYEAEREQWRLQHEDEQREWKQLASQLKEENQQQHDKLKILLHQQSVLLDMRANLPATVTRPAEAEEPQAFNRPPFPEQPFSLQASALENHIQFLFSDWASRIISRKQAILTAFKDAGIKYSVEEIPSGQGGPFQEANLELLPLGYDETLDDLTTLNELETYLDGLPDVLPVKEDKYYISSRYGYRKDPFNKKRAFHRGLDLAGWPKTKIYAPADGTVVRAFKNAGYGKFIEIRHNNGIITRYGHLHSFKVKRGQNVAKGQVIGLMGNTGRSTNNHLHYEIVQDDRYLNPLRFFEVISHVQQQ
ncbi:peptidoglycan DD-metalloendopeptidase family protein [Parasalinivibrio latis]|uniref:peptidoglycan DD-metalloendopeptidase family protein n=1 Tax=Parasalinivibrio latis TaxID=2952610 RepID=UPI0030DEF89A